MRGERIAHGDEELTEWLGRDDKCLSVPAGDVGEDTSLAQGLGLD